MEMFENEIQVQQGEDWNLDVLLSASPIEYIPFLISSERANPFFVITIASTKYEKNLRYVKSWWNDINSEIELPRFYQTTPVDLGELNNADEVDDEVLEKAFETYETRYLYQYTLIDDEVDEELGHKPYHYSYFTYNENGDVLKRRDDQYECRIRFNFLSSETSEWGSQNYMYQITLVSGELIADTLQKIAEANGMPDDWPVDDIEAQYRYVKVRWPDELQPDIDMTSPLGRIDSPQVITQPTKLTVFNNLRKII